MGRKEDMVKKIISLMENRDIIRNIGIIAHIHHGKTTISDNLLAAAGMISEELAGRQLYLNYDEQEQERCLTINSANVSMVHECDGKEYLINLIDTPGHVDFGGDVTRAMRAVDGAIVVVCAVEGVMAQTETVLRQALREKVKPVLFINKVDRAINELKLTAEMMQQRFVKIINDVNILIDKMVPEEFRDKWNVRVDDGSVAFGSGYHKWAISAPQMKQTGITFKDIYEYCAKDNQKELAKKARLYDVVFDMVVKHLPSPKEAQPYRVPQIWKGDMDSDIGKAMFECSKDSDLSFMITDITIDEHAGEVATGRIYSGAITKGTELSLAGTPYKNKAQQVAIYMGPERIPVDRLVAGNIAAVTGLRDAIAGTTASTVKDFLPFEEIRHISEPVVTVAIEAKHTKDLPKLVEVLREVAKEDPSLKVEINQETGEHLLSGMGELHIEITTYRIINDHGVDINISEPIVVYRETVEQKSPEFEGKSPNKHNRFYVEVEPLQKEIVDAMLDGTIPTGKIKDAKALAKTLQEMGMGKDESKKVVSIEGTNMFLDMTRGIQYLNETMELLIEAFKEVVGRGPRANEPVRGLKVRLVDAKLHEDAIHRGPAQAIPAMRNAIYGAMCLGNTILLEPKQKVTLNVPADIIGNGIQEIQGRRGIVEDMTQEADLATITAKAPVAEMFGFAAAIRSATGGRCLWATEHAGFEKLPNELQGKITREVRTRRGIKPEPPTASYYEG